MFSRVTVVQGSADKVEGGINSFRDDVLPALQGVDGYKGALLLVDRSSGKGYGISLWESEDARRRAADAVDAPRAAAIEKMGGSVSPVEELEVAIADL